MSSERDALRRWRAGHAAAAAAARELFRREGPDPERAVAECLAALSALEVQGLWPGPRDPVSEAAVQRVRTLWARLEIRARQARAR
jgi:hypothetical protein